MKYFLFILFFQLLFSSYEVGETMSINYTVPITNETQEHTVNLPALLEVAGKAIIEDYATTSKGFKITCLSVQK